MYHNFLHPISGSNHKSRLESFYEGQARSYDVYRHRFLHGRVPMIEAMPTPTQGVWVDLGGGTAANLEHFRDNLSSVFSKVIVLDLCGPLLEVARARVAANKWGKLVECIEADACDPKAPGLPPAGSVDVITMSYSLTMIPNWRAALDNALRLLKPGGHFAISDFTVTPENSCVTRNFWPLVLGTDGIHPTSAHIETLRELFDEKHLHVDRGGFPYVPLLKAPFYYFVGQKRVE
jgi:S-adenosylmethionine-diacylgycerolhomoserine-N-methlytransferase